MKMTISATRRQMRRQSNLAREAIQRMQGEPGLKFCMNLGPYKVKRVNRTTIATTLSAADNMKPWTNCFVENPPRDEEDDIRGQMLAEYRIS